MTPGKQKRPQATEEDQDETTSSEPKFKVPRKSPKKEKEVDNNEDILHKIQETRARLKEKEETVRKLRLVKMYRTKWEMQGLDTVTDQWLQACQEALVDLREKIREIRARETGEEELTLQLLMDNLGIDTKLLKLDEAEDCFTT
ncbi:hypothetical protein Pcinc_010523 [Petrolisthes cinctipes]|uniref:Swi5-dependent recombination DNA repair protein 1 homolog n=1 Tax=Petrolisthes cinctipes TaxID=88211 RepID=A0AAE1KUF6_PETCI|nr:hypothetical protein Pcinc_010523 [Petrolisthes cinctipes]